MDELSRKSVNVTSKDENHSAWLLVDERNERSRQDVSFGVGN